MNFTDEILALATEVIASTMDELEAGKWRTQFDALPFDGKKALFAAIADGFNDTIED